MGDNRTIHTTFQGKAMKGSLRMAALLLLIALAGCNTMEGLGKDVKKVGSEIEQAAG